MDPSETERAFYALRLVLTCIPAGAYMLLLWTLNYRSTPYVLTGRQDLGLLLMFITPMLAAAIDLQDLVAHWPYWLMVSGLVLLLGLLALPGEFSGLIFYNAARGSVEELIEQVLTELGHPPQRSGDRWLTSNGELEVTLHHFFSLSDNVSVHWAGTNTALGEAFEQQLSARAAELSTASRFAALPFAFAALAMLSVAGVMLVNYRTPIASLIRQAFFPES